MSKTNRNGGITRRDFLNGLSMGGAALMLGPKTLLAQALAPANASLDMAYYPPILNGIRGSHQGSFETAHALAWGGQKPKHYTDIDEEYDLVVVGGGISGLAAAYFYQKHKGGNQKILILDNHDDFGGHAKRNEFYSQDKMTLGFGGSQNMEYTGYGEVTSDVLQEIGIDFKKLKSSLDPDWSLGDMGKPFGMYLEGEADNKIVNGSWNAALHGFGDYKALVEQLPLAQDEKQRLISFIAGEKDVLADMSLSEKLNYAHTTSYNEFLKDKVGLKSPSLALAEPMIHALYAVGGDCVSVFEAIGRGAPGLRSLGWLGNLTTDLAVDPDNLHPVVFFPDGNASITRLFVRKLIPTVAPGKDMNDIVSAQFDYSQLDKPDNLNKIRLNSTAVQVENLSDDSVAVSYVDVSTGDAKNVRVKGKRCIMACYSTIVPHLIPELPAKQKAGLSYGEKSPLVYMSVLLRDGGIIEKTGVNQFNCPNSEYDWISTAPMVTMDDYKPEIKAGEPLVLFVTNTPPPKRDLNNPNQTARDLLKAGRHKLYRMSFDDYERPLKKQLNKMFGQYGFDADKDIEAITVNRWPHGYAYHYMELFDPKWGKGQAPHEIGRKPFGNITFANSDSEAFAYVDGAINAAWRSVKEQLLK